MKKGTCTYCNRKGPVRIAAEENDGKALYVCDVHWKLLQNPKTAIPLIQGTLSAQLRGSVPELILKVQMDRFLKVMKSMKSKNEIN